MRMAILLSVHQEWVEKIASGEKTVEVRKTAPAHLYEPFTVYMYESSGTQRVGNETLGCTIKGNGRMAVVGQFTCDNICLVDKDSIGYFFRWPGRIQYAGEPGGKYRDCMTPQQRWDYLGIKVGYGWHIKDVRMFKEPVPLPMFRHPCTRSGPCNGCKHAELDPQDMLLHCENRVQRPPQSWMYVEER